jgi:hypothetical protein
VIQITKHRSVEYPTIAETIAKNSMTILPRSEETEARPALFDERPGFRNILAVYGLFLLKRRAFLRFFSLCLLIFFRRFLITEPIQKPPILENESQIGSLSDCAGF